MKKKCTCAKALAQTSQALDAYIKARDACEKAEDVCPEHGKKGVA